MLLKPWARVRNLIDILGALALESFFSLRAVNDGDLTMALDLILGGTRIHKLQGSFCCKKWPDVVRALSPVPCKENFACRMWNPGLWNPEFSNLQSGIALTIGIRNPSSTVPLTKNPESKTVLEYLTWDASHNKFFVLKTILFSCKFNVHFFLI